MIDCYLYDKMKKIIEKNEKNIPYIFLHDNFYLKNAVTKIRTQRKERTKIKITLEASIINTLS